MSLEPLVLLPGMACDARLWWPQFLHLSRERAVQIAPLDQGNTIRDMAADVLAGAPERFALAGLSLGGIVAMEILRQAPERITRLALLSTDPLADTPHISAAREPIIARARGGRLEDALLEALSPDCLAPGPERERVLALVSKMGAELGADLFIRQMRALQRRADQQGTLRRASMPSLVLGGEYDTLCPPRRHELMADLIPGGRLMILPGAGHLPTLEQPLGTLRALRDWLAIEA